MEDPNYTSPAGDFDDDDYDDFDPMDDNDGAAEQRAGCMSFEFMRRGAASFTPDMCPG